jgi:hypothetical protein
MTLNDVIPPYILIEVVDFSSSMIASAPILFAFWSNLSIILLVPTETIIDGDNKDLNFDSLTFKIDRFIITDKLI